MWVIKITFQLRQENVNKKKVKEKNIHIKRICKRQVFINTQSTLGPFSRLENKVHYDITSKQDLREKNFNLKKI